MTPIERVGVARLLLYDLYDRDVQAIVELEQFHAVAWQGLAAGLRALDDCLPDLPDASQRLSDQVGPRAAEAYLLRLSDLARRLGLDRIRQVGVPPFTVVEYLPSGEAQAHRYLWRLDRITTYERAPSALRSRAPPPPRPTMVQLASFGVGIPAVETSIAGREARWDPRRETLADARKRLRRETDLPSGLIDVELDRIADEGDYVLPDTSTIRSGVPRRARDAQFVYWRIRHGWSYRQIAQRWALVHPGDLQGWNLREKDDESKTAYPLLPTDAIEQVRRATGTFAARARIDVRTGPGRKRLQARTS